MLDDSSVYFAATNRRHWEAERKRRFYIGLLKFVVSISIIVGVVYFSL